MYAAIRRYVIDSGSTDDLAHVGYLLGIVLTSVPGFVAAVALEDENRALVSVSLFEDRAGLLAAQSFAERWIVEHGTLDAAHAELATGEVVAQKGL